MNDWFGDQAIYWEWALMVDRIIGKASIHIISVIVLTILSTPEQVTMISSIRFRRKGVDSSWNYLCNYMIIT